MSPEAYWKLPRDKREMWNFHSVYRPNPYAWRHLLIGCENLDEHLVRMMEHDRGELEEIEKLGAKAIRPERRVSDDDLIASELACAVLSEPLGKIRHVCEALMLLDEGEREQAGITEDEAKEAEKLYKLATAIQNAHINREMDRYSNITIDRNAVIPWPFPQKSAAEWLEWIGEDFRARYYPSGSDEYNEKVSKKLRELPHLEAIHYMTSEEDAMMGTYKGVVIRFVNYAMPKATRLLKKIIHLVSPDSYKQALQLMRGRRRGKA